jgi:hypothetical protein
MDIATSNKPKQINKRLLEEVLEEMDKKSDSPVDEEITQSAKEIKVSSKGLMSKKIDIEDDIDGN